MFAGKSYISKMQSIFKAGMLCLGMIHLSACGEVAHLPGEGSDFYSSKTKLALTPANQTIGVGETLQFKAVGGEAPYTFVVTGGGYISAYGLYSAPATIVGEAIAVTVYVTDALGYTASTTVTVSQNSSVLKTSYSPAIPSINTPVKISVTGGEEPYNFILISGLGTLNGDTYTTGLLGETAMVKVVDRLGRSAIVSIAVSGPSHVITAIGLTKLGTHVIGGGGCVPGASFLGSVADGGGNTIYGDQIFCAFAGVPSANTAVLAGITVTNPGSACPKGYESIGQIRYCPNGKCNGTQNVCVAYRYSQEPGPTVTDFYVTPQYLRDPNGPACAAGYTRVGTTVNCGGGYCSGLQSFCASIHQ